MTDELEFPRHVHKGGGWGVAGGESRVVTLAEFAAALTEGWTVDPNEAYVPPSNVAGEPPAAAQDDAGDVSDTTDEEPAPEPDEDAGEASDESEGGEEQADEAGTTAGEAVERTKRKPGRPRRNG